MFSSLFVCLSVFLLATLCKDFRTDLHEVFTKGWQWANEQMFKFCWRSGSEMVAIRIRDPDPYRDTGKTCLDRGTHCPSASSFVLKLYLLVQFERY